MIRSAILIAAALPLVACAPAPKPPAFRCTNEPTVTYPIRATMIDGKIAWIDSKGARHDITGAPDEWAWSCVPDDGRLYPVDHD